LHISHSSESWEFLADEYIIAVLFSHSGEKRERKRERERERERE
jgi:hypothetical protein